MIVLIGFLLSHFCMCKDDHGKRLGGETVRSEYLFPRLLPIRRSAASLSTGQVFCLVSLSFSLSQVLAALSLCSFRGGNEPCSHCIQDYTSSSWAPYTHCASVHPLYIHLFFRSPNLNVPSIFCWDSDWYSRYLVSNY